MEDAVDLPQEGSEVFVSGNASIVVLEDTPRKSDHPLPSRGPPSPPLQHTRQTYQEQGQVHEVLPAEELARFADMSALANPHRMVKENKKQEGPPPEPEGQRESPVPSKFPPAPGTKPTRRRKERPRQSPPPPAPPPPSRESSPPKREERDRGAWETPFHIEDDGPADVFGLGETPSRRRAPQEFPMPEEEPVQQRPRPKKEVRRSSGGDSVPPEELRRRRKEEERNEKMQLLHRLYQFEQRGHRMANSYSMDSSVDELRFEVAKIRNEESARRAVKWSKMFLMFIVSMVENMNTQYDPFGLKLQGWTRDMNSKKDDLDDCFHRLHDKYSSKMSVEPELELAIAFFGGAFTYHLQNSTEGTMIGGLINGWTGGGASKSTGASKSAGSRAPSRSVSEPPARGKPQRRVMKPPAMPAGTMEMANTMSAMMSDDEEDDDNMDIPLDFSGTVGGQAPPKINPTPPPPVSTRRPAQSKPKPKTEKPVTGKGFQI